MQVPSVPLGPEWKDFFITAAGASAALAGLVTVAISVNVQRILEQPQLPSRGGATVAALVLILVSSMAELIPQSRAAFAIEISLFGFIVWLLHMWSARHMVLAYSESRVPLHQSVIAIAIGQLEAIPFMIGGVLLLIGRRAGPYWIAWGIIATFVFSVVNTWILLIEILR